jgi:hypothetical protein
MQQSDRHSADIKRDHVLSAGGAGMRQSQIDILQSLNEITYVLYENAAESDRHYEAIKRDYILSV